MTVIASDLYAEVAGVGPAVVLVHEGICDSRMWDPQWETFTRSYRVLRYDMRGFGRSPLEPGTYSHARDLIRLLDELDLGRAALVGGSLGGRVALEVAVARPELVSALVLVGVGLPGHDWSQEVQAAWTEEEAALERGDLDAAVEVNLRTWVDGPRRGPDEVDPAVRERVGQMQRRALELWMAVGEAAKEESLVPNVAGRLGEISVPTLVLMGDDDMPDMHVNAERLGREIREARRASIANAAHVPSLERPVEFDELVLGFLAEAVR